MNEVQIWDYVIKWGIAQNSKLSSDPSNYSNEDFNILKNILQHCIPLIKFTKFTSKEFLNKVYPYKKILPEDLYESLIIYFLDPDNNNPNTNDRSVSHITKETKQIHSEIETIKDVKDAKDIESEPLMVNETKQIHSKSHTTKVIQSELEVTKETKENQSKPLIPKEINQIQSEPQITEETKKNQSKPLVPKENNQILSEPRLIKETKVIQPKPLIPKETNQIQSEPPITEETKENQSKPLITKENNQVQSELRLIKETKMVQTKPLVPKETNQINSQINEGTKVIKSKPSFTKGTKLIIDSKIISNQHAELISKWIDKVDTANSSNTYNFISKLIFTHKSNFLFKLLFRGSRDGFTPKNFHDICDNQSQTITIIKVKDSDEILGGYNPIEWKHNYGYGITKDSFIFSFNKENINDHIISRVKEEKNALNFWNRYGPSFGFGDLIIYGGPGDYNFCDNNNYCRKRSYDKPIRKSEKTFCIEEYEVFQVIKKN